MSVISRCAKLVSGERTHTKDIFRCHLVFFDEIWITNLGGELEVKLQYTSSSITNTSGVRHNGKDELDNERESEEDGEEEEDKKDKTKNEIEENQKTQSEIKKEMERLEQIEVKPGDYAISVHIIEVRDLHPAGDSNGCADPVVRYLAVQRPPLSPNKPPQTARPTTKG